MNERANTSVLLGHDARTELLGGGLVVLALLVIIGLLLSPGGMR